MIARWPANAHCRFGHDDGAMADSPAWPAAGTLGASLTDSENTMRQTFFGIATALSLIAFAGASHAQLGKAASEASDAAEHKIDQKRAESDAKKSGPVGKAVNNVKSEYHKNRSKNSAEKAKDALKGKD